MPATRHHDSASWEEILDSQLGLDNQPISLDQSESDWRDKAIGSTELALDDRTVTVDDLRRSLVESNQHGLSLDHDIYDDSDVLLLSAGSHITAKFLQLLQSRNIQRVHLRPTSIIHSRDVEPEPTPEPEPTIDPFSYHTAISRELDERLAGDLGFRQEYHPVRAWRRPRLAINDLKNEAIAGVEKHEATSAAVEDICDSLKTGKEISASDLRNTVNRFVDMAAVDFDLLPLIVSLQHSGDEYLYDHCVNVSLLSMAIASQQGLDRDAIATIGLGGLLQDIGMLRVPESIRLSTSNLTEDEWEQIKLHPLHTLDMLADIRGIPRLVKLIAYQTHERADGSGYPRRRTEQQVHEYAKIVAVADTYSAMIRERPYRKAMSPYTATTTLLHAGAEHQYDRSLLRAFLDSVSLFPIGSRITLSDGTLARVLRSNPELHTKPIVEAVSNDGTPLGLMIDLSLEDSPSVTQAY